MRRLPLLLIFVLATVAAGCSRGADHALSAVEAAVRKGDVAGFRACLSRATVTFLREWLGEGKIDGAAAFMMDRLKRDLPWKVVAERRDGMDLTFTLTGKSGKSDLKYVWGGGAWKLDLVEGYRAWRKLLESAEEVGDKMRRTAPLLGFEGPGARFLHGK